MNRGQSTIETIFSIGVVLIFVFLLYAFLIYPRIDQSDSLQKTHIAQSICGDLRNAINTVAYNGNGFTTALSLPPTVSGSNYTITVYSRTIDFSWDGKSIYCQYRARNVSFAGSYPPFTISSKRLSLNNSNGVVKIV